MLFPVYTERERVREQEGGREGGREGEAETQLHSQICVSLASVRNTKTFSHTFGILARLAVGSKAVVLSLTACQRK